LAFDQYLVTVEFKLAVNARIDLFPDPALWKTSMPHTIVGLFIKGKVFTAHGSPPILAQI